MQFYKLKQKQWLVLLLILGILTFSVNTQVIDAECNDSKEKNDTLNSVDSQEIDQQQQLIENENSYRNLQTDPYAMYNYHSGEIRFQTIRCYEKVSEFPTLRCVPPSSQKIEDYVMRLLNIVFKSINDHLEVIYGFNDLIDLGVTNLARACESSLAYYQNIYISGYLRSRDKTDWYNQDIVIFIANIATNMADYGYEIGVMGCLSQGIRQQADNVPQRIYVASMYVLEKYMQLWTDEDFEDNVRFDQNLQKIFGQFMSILNPIAGQGFRELFVIDSDYLQPNNDPKAFLFLNNYQKLDQSQYYRVYNFAEELDNVTQTVPASQPILTTRHAVDFAREFFGVQDLPGLVFESEYMNPQYWDYNKFVQQNLMTFDDLYAGEGYLNMGPREFQKTWVYNDVIANVKTDVSLRTELVRPTEFYWKFITQTGFNYRLKQNAQMEPLKWVSRNVGDRSYFFGTDRSNFSKWFGEKDIQCTYFRDGIGKRGTQQFIKDHDQLIMPILSRSCSNPKNLATGDAELGNEFGYNSKCFDSNVIQTGSGAVSEYGDYRCHTFRCDAQNNVNIYIGENYYPCSNGVCAISGNGYEGTVTLPDDVQGLCKDWPRTCPEYCSQHGYCENNVCHCLDGRAGVGCEIECDYIAVDGVCVNTSTCPEGTEWFEYSRSCVTPYEFEKGCEIGEYIQNGECVQTCSDGYYAVEEDQTCQPCDSTCATCTISAGNCLTCASGYEQGGNLCKLCEEWLPNCENCSSYNTCATCSDGYFITEQGDCAQCNPECATCSSENICLTCINQDEFVGPNGVCQTCAEWKGASCESCSDFDTCTQCAQGFYLQGGNCYECVAPCATCDSESNCLSCIQGENREDASLDCICQSGFFENSGVCSSCQYPCGTCSDSETCLSCSTSEGRGGAPDCLCLDGFFDNQTACVECSFPCENCLAEDECLSCAAGENREGVDQNCQCVQGYTDVDQVCQACEYPCAQCEGSVGNCTVCVNSENRTSDCNCQDAFYDDGAECKACVAPCQLCNSADSCVTCLSGYKLGGDQCKTCSEWLDNCSACSNYQTCITCDSGYYLQNGQCYQCVEPCVDCTSETTCSTCIDGYFFKGGECKTCENWISGCQTCVSANSCAVCSDGNYLNEQQTCSSCSEECATCENSSQCTTCASGYFSNYSDEQFQNLESCLATCPDGKYEDTQNQRCSICDESCLTCSGGQNTDCTSCVTGTYLLNQECLTTCPNTYYNDTETNTCQECDASCGQLGCNEGGEAGCKICPEIDQNLPYYYEGGCVAECPEGTYVSEVDGYTCEECYLSCRACVGGSDTDCTACDQSTVTHYFIEETGQCVSDCVQAGYSYQNEEELICENCNGCLTCSGDITFCTSCESGSYLYENTCIEVCPAGYYGNTEANECVPCSQECATCANDQVCYSCVSGYYYFPAENQCLSYLPSGTYLDNNNEIQYCEEICAECSDGATCTSCKDNLALFEGDCLTACPTKTYLDTVNMECLYCNQQCQECDNNNTDFCTECANGYYEFYDENNNLLCLITCPSTYFAKDTYSGNELISQQCIKCSSSIAHCDLCDNEDTCTSCKQETNTKYFLKPDQSQCVLANQCGTGYYPNTSTYTCEECNAACASCTGGQISDCQSCNSGFYLAYQSTCVSVCPDGFYEEEEYLICNNCSSNCKNCEGSADYCTSCYDNTYLLNNQCVQECGDGLYEDSDSNSCQVCDETCLTCEGGENSDCESCPDGRFYFSGYCLNDCGEGRYADVETQTCMDCLSSCNTCTSYTYCTSCNYPYKLENGNCVNSWCAPGSWSSQYCNDDCTENCETCYGAFSSNCLSCSEGYYLHNNYCVATCPASHYEDEGTQSCQECSTNCAQCSSISSCTGCVAGYFLNSNNKCVLNCADGTYADVSTGKCEVCSSDCKNCSTIPSQCTSCNQGTYLSGQECVTECPSGSYGGSGECLNCSTQCVECKVNADNCTQCPNGTYLLASTTEFNQCLASCPDGYYQDSSINECKTCATGCLTCESETGTCLTCASGYLLEYGTCTPGCQSGYYLENSSCKLCPATCTECESASVCSSCSHGYVLVRDFCRAECDSGTYRDQETLECVECEGNCSQCTAQSCQECTNWTYLFQGQCVWYCPYYSSVYAVQVGAVGNYCAPCDDACQYCYTGGSDHCDQCANGYYRIQGTTSCVQTCPDGYYGVSYGNSNNQCVQCHSKCLTCEGDRDQCTSCEDGMYLSGNKCVKDNKCPSKTYPDSSTNTCSSCDSTCKTCDGSSNDECTSCYSNKILVKGECIDHCEDGKYYNESKQKCENCSNKCENCRYDKEYCVSCPNGSYLVQKSHTCSSTAPDGYYIDGTVLKECSDLCETCSGSAENCTSCDEKETYLENGNCICHEGTYLSYSCRGKAQCLKYCPYGYYKDEEGNTCEKCAEGCKKCDENSCQQCSAYQSLSEDGKSCICANYMYMYQGSCYWSCPYGYYADNENRSCEACSEGCLGCGGEGECWGCRFGYVLHQGYCVKYDQCPEGFWAGVFSYACQACSDECQDCENCYSCSSCAEGYFMNSANKCVVGCADGYFENQESNTCDRCMDNCQNCEDGQSCQLCGNGYYLNDGICVQSCPSGTWKNVNGKTCEDCQDGCLDCVSDSQCSNCDTGYVLINNACHSVCQNNQYRDQNLECQDCDQTCASCQNNANYCLTCASGYVLNLDNTCQASCQDGSYLVAQTTFNSAYCQECDVSCATCYGSSNSECYTCETGYNKFGSNQCLQNCPSGYAAVNGVCTACQSPCKTCSSTVDTCNSCQTGYYLYKNQCVSTCPSKTFLNEQNQICQDCHSSCKSCYGSSQYQCNSCITGYYYIDSMDACVDDCPTGYYENTTQQICSVCPDSCKLCTGANTCQSCKENYFLSNGLCLETCPVGQYGNSNTHNCEDCNSACKTCYGPGQTACYTCEEGYQQTGSICTIGCPNRYFLNEQEECQACSQDCQNCENSENNCTTCELGLYLYQNQCYDYCPEKTYSNREESECVDCSQNCLICQESGCISCVSGFALNQNGQCAELNCGEGEYADTNSCENCINQCKICEDGNSCLECYEGYLIYQGTCYAQDTVIDGYYPDLEQGAFLECPGSCTSCTSQYNCTACSDGLEVYDGACVSECASGQFRNQQGECESCDVGCSSCYGPSNTQCESCASGYVQLEVSSCVQSCPDGYYQYQNEDLVHVCGTCDENCLSCSGQASYCTDCDSGKYILNNVCYQDCPAGYYGNSSTQQCETCDEKCETCYGSAVDQCYSCSENYYLSGTHTCVDTCEDGFFANSATQICQQCDLQSCKTCSGSANNCLSCAVGKYFHNNFCMEICPSGFYENGDNGKCTACNENCRECTGPNLSQCSSCLGDYYYQESKQKCVLTCETGTYPVNNVCADCQIGCKSCTDQENCAECTYGYYLINGECLTQCPDGYYQNKNNLSCIACADGCATCSGNASKCTSCEDGSYYLESRQTCKKNCPKGYFANDETNTCEQCTGGCTKCEGMNQCTKCEDNFVLLNGVCTYRCPSGYRQNESNNSCEACPENCSYCFGNNSNKCNSCDEGFYLYENQCLSECPSGYYGHIYPINHVQYHLDIANSLCLPCDSGCTECSGASNYCLSCENGLTLSDGVCVSECPSGSFRNQNGKCKKCNNACTECFGKSKKSCLECAEGYYLEGTECTKKCSEQFYLDENTQSCQSCASPCKSCSGFNVCDSCDQGFVLQENRNVCLINCDQGYYKDQNKCEACPSNCQACQDFTFCTICAEGYYLYDNQCLPECPTNYYANQLPYRECKKCSQEYCDDCNKNTCLSCSEGYEIVGEQCLCEIGTFSYNGMCINTAPEGYYLDNSTRAVEKCHEKCSACTGPNEEDCTDCALGLYFNGETGLCGDTCQEGYYKGVSFCRVCSQRCETCSDGFSCETCKEGLFLVEGQCYYICPVEYFNNGENCQSCSEIGCLTCNSQQECLSCQENNYLYQNSCLTQEQVEEIEGVVIIGNEVMACDASCSSCSGSVSHCLSCQQGFYLQGNSCVSACGNGFYLEQNSDSQVCSACYEGCKSCYGGGADQCSACLSEYGLVGSSCVQECGDGKYVQNGVCVACAGGCSLCENNGDCLECKEGFLLVGDQCQKCSSECASCGDSLDDCLSCAFGYYLNSQGSCVDSCESGYYGNSDTGNCEACSQNCATCYGAGNDQCLTCAQYFTGAPNCVPSQPNCKTGKYVQTNYDSNGDIISYSCEACAEGCYACTDINSCSSCNQGYYLNESNMCASLPETKDGKYVYLSSCGWKTYYCPRECETCGLTDVYDRDTLMCYTCENGYELNSDGSCTGSNSCDNDQYSIQFWGRTYCYDCPSGCTSCSYQGLFRGVDCSSCEENYTLRNGNCVKSCADNEYQSSSGKCKSCHYTCASCSGSGSNSCETCISGYEYNNGKCTKKTQQPTTCTGGNSYYNYWKKSCSCFNWFKVYTQEQGCISWSQYLKSYGCGQGSYYNSKYNQCGTCASNNKNSSKLLCKTCDGGYASDCTECISGYYLQTSNYSCQQCASGCQECSDYDKCDVCEKGTYKVVQDGKISCQSFGCPVGYSVDENSLYLLNQDIVVEGETDYQLKNGVPSYKGKLVTLECTVCTQDCDACVEGLVYDSSARTCSLPVSDLIEFKSENAKGNQNDNENLILRSSASSSSYEWSLIKMANKKNKEIELKNKHVRNFFEGVDTASRTLQIPAENLKEKRIYTLQLTLGNGSSEQIEIKVEENDDENCDLSNLGLSQEMIKISPLYGQAGETEFTVSFNFNSYYTKVLKGWIFTVSIENTNLSYSFESLNDAVSFEMPGKLDSGYYAIIISASKGNYKYSLSRSVYVSENKNYDFKSHYQKKKNNRRQLGDILVTNESIIQVILTQTELLANLALNDSYSYSTISYIQEQIPDLISQLSELSYSQSQLESILLIVQNLANSKALISSSAINCVGILGKLTEFIGSKENMEVYLSTTEKLIKSVKNGEVSGLSLNDQYSSLVKLRKLVSNGISQWAQMYNYIGAVGILDTESAKIMVQTIDTSLKSEITSNLETSTGQETSVSIDAEAFAGKDQVTLISMVAGSDYYGDSDFVYGDQIEIKLLDSEGKAISVEDLSSTEKISFVLSTSATLGEDGLPQNSSELQDIRCAYWDESAGKYKIEGVLTVSSGISGSVKCQASHLTQFTVMDYLAQDLVIKPRIYVNEDEAGSESLRFVGLAFLVFLAVFL